MSPPLSRRETLALVSTTGVSVLSGCQGLTAPLSRYTADPQEQERDTETTALVYAKSSNASFPRDDASSPSGWVHIVSDGESADLTFDVRLCSSLEDVEPEVIDSSGNEYVLRFEVSADLSGKSVSDESTGGSTCDSVTRLTGSTNVPSDWETISVRVNNTEVQPVEKSGTMPELRRLPDPIHFE
ncbi:hypothetical protein GCM10009021_07870 [Halarchaeum nitratireducens]|uniref:Uncharacterized protein n=1 Tax=Halarchaeum nitratireducens TaxID=489913 RepID=A0A830G8N1_9EURY|nr:hypothetical protein GCM10009021_07870 [Halarchaeum nitratireducens]